EAAARGAGPDGLVSEATAEPQASPDATTLVTTCLDLLATKAWEAMGLVPNPVTKKIGRDLAEAQLAIDAAAALADLVRSRVSDADRREIENLITTLRLNFVEQKSKAP
ncbi:MAG: DUF1844 domain-containing protein, partial [Armatimonadetes bacterium]|nr:DUF1844 domain-containing protein [Armatimonadota bacterium]